MNLLQCDGDIDVGQYGVYYDWGDGQCGVCYLIQVEYDLQCICGDCYQIQYWLIEFIDQFGDYYGQICGWVVDLNW